MTKSKAQAPQGVHVVPARKHENGLSALWAVEIRGRRQGTFPTQAEAIGCARRLARNAGAELLIHGRDGKIRRKDSHGRDPRPPRGPRG